MDIRRLSLFHRVGYLLLILSGVPLTTCAGKRAVVAVKYVICVVCLTSKLIASLVASYYLVKAGETPQEHATETVSYYSKSWIAYYWELLAVHLILFRASKELQCAFDMVQSVEETVIEKMTRPDNTVVLWKAFIVFTTLPGLVVSAHENNLNFLNITGLTDASKTVFTFLLLCLAPVYLFSWIVFYNMAAIWTTVIESSRAVLKKASEERLAEGLNLENPPSEFTRSSIYLVYDSTSKREHWSGRLLRLFTVLKMLRIYTNKMFSTPLLLFMVFNAFFVPVVFYSFFELKSEVPGSSWYKSEVLYNIFWILMFILLPVFMKEWTKKVIKDSALVAKRNIYTSTTDLDTKRRLQKFVASAADEYPESFFKFFNLDFALLSSILDVTVLLGTTFVLPPR